MALHKLIFDTTDAGTRGDSAKVGAVLYDAVNDRLGVINASQELQVRDDDANTSLDAIEVDIAAIEVEQLAQGVTLDAILVDTGVIAGDTTSIDALLTALSKAEDAAHVSGDQGIMGLAVRNDTEGSLVDTDGDYAPLQVDSSGRLRVVADLDTTNLAEKAEDSAHVSGDIGNYVLTVREDTLATSTSATGDYQSFKSDSLGKLYVNAPDSDAILTTIDSVLDAILVDTGSIDDTLTALSKTEDAAHSSGDQGIQALAVRNDTLASLVDTDGDYAPFQVNADGALYVAVESINDAALADTAMLANAESVGTTIGQIVDGGDELANRKYLFLYNNGNRDIYVGQTGITTGTGFPIPAGAIFEARIGAAVDVFAIGESGTQDVRALQLS